MCDNDSVLFMGVTDNAVLVRQAKSLLSSGLNDRNKLIHVIQKPQSLSLIMSINQYSPRLRAM